MKPMTSRQAGRITIQVINETPLSLKAALKQLREEEQLDHAGAQRLIGRLNRIRAKLIPRLKEMLVELAEEVLDYAKLISGTTVLELGATNGTRTIAEAGSVFTSGIYGFQKSERKTVPAKKTRVKVFEMTRNGNFGQIFGSFGDNLDSLCLTEDQIIQFVEKHRTWLHPEWATFFLYKEGDEFFVARVYLYSDGPHVRRSPLSDGRVWYAECRHRIVVPQLTLETQS